MRRSKIYECTPCLQRFRGRANYEYHLAWHRRNTTKAERLTLNSPPPPPPPPEDFDPMFDPTPQLW